jgi:hypothetical protein
LQFWLANKDKYPILSIIARKYLQIPATSASSERFFSQGALIISKQRNRLNKDTFEKIICPKSWGVIKEEIEEDKEEIDKEEKENIFII